VSDNMTLDSNASVETEFVETYVKDLRKGKAPGVDGVSLLADLPVLANLFMSMLRLGHIPPEIKTGAIFTLHKKGKKRKDNPNNYGVITLSSVILKLYEVVLLDRCQDTIMKTLSNNAVLKNNWVVRCQHSAYVKHSTMHVKNQRQCVFAV